MFKLVLLLGAVVALGVLPARSRGGEIKKGFIPLVHKSEAGDSKYVLFVPHGYDGSKKYPLILFLHGAGERGDDGQLPVMQGIGNAIKFKGGEKKFPCFVIFPQCKKRSSWKADSPDGKRALAILEEIQKNYKIDNNRIYLTGLSMGGYGTWSLATAHPNKWAAIAPICGGGDPAAAESIKHIPCWCFHGAEDKAVPVGRSREMIKALEKVGGQPRYSEFPYVGHNSWDSAYVTPELIPWMLGHRLKKN